MKGSLQESGKISSGSGFSQEPRYHSSSRLNDTQLARKALTFVSGAKASSWSSIVSNHQRVDAHRKLSYYPPEEIGNCRVEDLLQAELQWTLLPGGLCPREDTLLPSSQIVCA